MSRLGQHGNLRLLDEGDHRSVANLTDLGLFTALAQRRVILLPQRHLARETVLLQRELGRAGDSTAIFLLKFLQPVLCFAKRALSVKRLRLDEPTLCTSLCLTRLEIELIDTSDEAVRNRILDTGPFGYHGKLHGPKLFIFPYNDLLSQRAHCAFEPKRRRGRFYAQEVHD